METQPLEYPSAGSVFRNPFNDFAGRLVEECNLKGKQIGGAMISLKHANFIINKDNEWECPNCGNKDHNKMSVVRRTCGYLGENFWNVGKTKEIKQRVLHL